MDASLLKWKSPATYTSVKTRQMWKRRRWSGDLEKVAEHSYVKSEEQLRPEAEVTSQHALVYCVCLGMGDKLINTNFNEFFICKLLSPHVLNIFE